MATQLDPVLADPPPAPAAVREVMPEAAPTTPIQTAAIKKKAPKWSDVASRPEFQELSSAEQEDVRKSYFDEVVAPQVGSDDLETARTLFNKDTRSSTLGRVAHDAKRTLDVAADVAGPVIDRGLSAIGRGVKQAGETLANPPPVQRLSPPAKMAQQGVSGAGLYDPFIEEAAKTYQVPAADLRAMLNVESSGNPDATSAKGAQGLMQLMPGTAAEMGVTNPNDPRQNILGGARYYRQMLDRYKGNRELAIAAYNAGPGTVDKAGGVPSITETRNHVAKVMGRAAADQGTRTDMASGHFPGDAHDHTGELMPFLQGGKNAAHVRGLNSAFQGRLAAMLKDAPAGVQIMSGYRSPERQTQLWQAALAKYGSPEAARKWVAPPGHSNHNHGIASDLTFANDQAKQWVHENAKKYGLNFRMAHEGWHIEPIEAHGDDADWAKRVGVQRDPTARDMSKELYGLALKPGYVDTVRAKYDAASPAERAAMISGNDVESRVARYVDDGYRQATSVTDLNAELAGFGTRREDRANSYLDQGFDRKTANQLANEDLLLGRDTRRLQEPERPSLLDQVKTDWQRGVLNTQAMGAGLGAWARDVTGNEEKASELLRDYQDLTQEAAQYAPVIGDFDKIGEQGLAKVPEDVARYMTEAIVGNLPNFLPSLALGGVGGLAARRATQGIVNNLIEKLGAAKAAEFVAAKTAQAAQGFGRIGATAEAIKAKGAAELAQQGVTAALKNQAAKTAMGAAAGAGAASVGMETGSIYGDIYDQTGQMRPGVAGAAGLAAGALDAIPAMRAATKLVGPAVTEAVAGTVMSRLGKEAGIQFLSESGTEFMQTLVENGAVHVVEGKPLVNEQDVHEALNAALQGGIAGSATGVATQGLSEVRGAMEREPSTAAQLGAALQSQVDRVREGINAEAIARDRLDPNQAPSSPAAMAARGVTPKSEPIQSRELPAWSAQLPQESGREQAQPVGPGPTGAAGSADRADGGADLLSFAPDYRGQRRGRAESEPEANTGNADAQVSRGAQPSESEPAGNAGGLSEHESGPGGTAGAVKGDIAAGDIDATDVALSQNESEKETGANAWENLSVLERENWVAKAGWGTKKGAANAFGKKLAQKPWVEINPEHRAKLADALTAAPISASETKAENPIDEDVAYPDEQIATARAGADARPAELQSSPAPQGWDKAITTAWQEWDSGKAVRSRLTKAAGLTGIKLGSPARSITARNWEDLPVNLQRDLAKLYFKPENQDEKTSVSIAPSGGAADDPSGGAQRADAVPISSESPAKETVSGETGPATAQAGLDREGESGSGALNWVEHTTGKGKTIRGIVRKDLTVQQAKAIDPFTFKKDGGFFIREKHVLADRQDGVEVQNPKFITPAVRKAFREWQASGEETYFGEDGRRSFSIEDSAVHDGLVEFGTTSTQGNARSAGGQKVFENRQYFRKSDLEALAKDAQPDQFPDATKMVEEAPDGSAPATDKDSLTVGATPEESSAVDNNSLSSEMPATPEATPATPEAQAATDDMADLKAQMGQAIGELAALLGAKSNLTEEEETRLIPIMSKIFRIAAKMGYIQFKEAGRHVMQQIRELAGNEIADKLSIDNLQAGYINIASEIGGDKKAALTVESIEELMAEGAPDKSDNLDNTSSAPAQKRRVSKLKGTDNVARIDETAGLPARDTQGSPGAQLDSAGDRQSLDTGLAGSGQETDRDRRVSAGTDGAGGAGSGRVGRERGQLAESDGKNPVGRTESGVSDRGDLDHVIEATDEVGKGGLTAKYRDNIKAIQLIKALEAENRTATPAERKQLARYVGWGALKGVFDPDNKTWAKQYKELRGLLNDDEWASARASILNAHYTSPAVVESIYDGVSRLGFTGGRLLEPSMGSGNFFGLMPANVRQASQLHGVELDNLTSRLAKALYPNAIISAATGFQEYSVPSDYFDLVIGNPPFGNEKIVDRQRSPYSGFSIHNYFLSRMLDKVREGGVVAAVVSHNFMDVPNSPAREWMAERANLLGAVRLPNTAFKGNAGTEVVTDILFFQKTATPEKNPAWVNTSSLTLQDKDGHPAEVNVNDYFLGNPKNILGQQTATGTMYRAGEYDVEPNGDLADQLKTFMASLPAGVYRSVERSAEELNTADNTIPPGIKQGSFYVAPNGQVRERLDDVAGQPMSSGWPAPNAKAEQRMKGMIELRELLKAQLRMERDPEATERAVEANRAKLKQAYTQFQKAHGYLNNATNRRLFGFDTEAPLVQALEFDYDKGVSKAVAEKDGREPSPEKADEADILNRRVLFPPQEAINVSSAQDALLSSLNLKGRIDMGYLSEVYGKPEAAVIQELGDSIFRDPLGESWQTADEYLSGDVKTKLEQAKQAAEGDSAYRRNVAALEKVIPKDRLPSEIYAGLGAGWIPAADVEAFAREISGMTGAKVQYMAPAATWLTSFDGSGNRELMVNDYGTERMNSLAILAQLLNGKPVEVKDRVSDPSTSSGYRLVTNESETEKAKTKADKIKSLWDGWLFGDPERAERLAALFNDKFNRTVSRGFDGSHLTLPGITPVISLRPHQKNVIWRGIQERNILLDHVVGAGKTFAAVATVMEMKRLGISRKPLLTVPNHLTQQWKSDFARLYPAANVLAAEPDDFAKGNRERLFSKMATGDWDAVIVGHSSLKKIGLDPEIEARFLKQQQQEIADAIEEMKRERGDKSIVRDMEKIKANLDAKITDLVNKAGERDKVLSFNELGIDGLVVDEHHEFKNLFFTTQKQRVSGLGNPKGSGKAFDLFFKIRWLQETLGEKAPLITATGTPVSNSLAEMFTMQRYMRYDELKRQGAHLFDAWANLYGSDEYVYEVAPSGVGYRISQRFAKFKNLPSLMGQYQQFADTVTLQDLKDQAASRNERFPVPKIEGGRPQNIVAARSALQRNFFGVPEIVKDESGETQYELQDPALASIATNAEGKFVLSAPGLMQVYETQAEAELGLVTRALTPQVTLDPKSIVGQFENLRQLTKQSKGKINALSLTGLASKAGLDMRLIDPSAPDNPGSKINLAVSQMMRLYQQWGKDKGTQLVFCDLSVPASARKAAASQEKRVYVRDEKGQLTHKKGTLHAVEGREGLPFYLVQTGKGDKRSVTVYEAVTGQAVKSGLASKAEAMSFMSEQLDKETNRDKWFDLRERVGAITDEDMAEYRDANEIETDGEDEITLDDLEASSGSAKFSVYDDIKAKLTAQGVPEHEIAFIHDYHTPKKKAELFKRVNRGEVRFLLGSTPKLGAGTNVQQKLVGLHHIDAPWRPSDLEQREGRIIRQGNKLYERDPDGFEVFIGRYATEQTYDTRRWQIIEHKAAGIEQLRRYSGELEIEDVGGEAANAADMKAAASGNPLILEETRLRNDVKRLTALQKADMDSKARAQSQKRRAIRALEESIPEQEREYQTLIDATLPPPKDSKQIAGFAIDGQRTTSREAAIEAINQKVTALRKKPGRAEIGYRGLTFEVEADLIGSVALFNPLGHRMGGWDLTEAVSGVGLLTRMNNYVEALPSRLDELAARRKKEQADIDLADKVMTTPFAEAAELEASRTRHAEVQRRLMKSSVMDAVPAEERTAFMQEREARKAELAKQGYGQAVEELEGDTPKLSRSELMAGGSDQSPIVQADDQTAAAELNRGMVRYFGDKSWENAYVQVELPDALSGLREAVATGFGRELVGIFGRTRGSRAINGVNYQGKLYLNVNADVGFVQLGGHELLHQLKRDRPDLYRWFAGQARGYYKNFSTYQDKLNALLKPGESPYNKAAAEEELLADFAGDALADPQFVERLAKADPGRFRQLLKAVMDWLKQVGDKLSGKGLGSSEYFTDVETLRNYLADTLVAYGQGGSVAIRKVEKPKFSSSFGGETHGAQLQKEYEDTRARYINTPQWLKAPNGQPSNLNEQQWVMVRTPRFKAWFGDWEALARQAKVKELIQKSLDDKSWQQRTVLAEGYDADPSGKLSEAFGFDVVRQYLTPDDIRKTDKRHGDGKERNKDQIGLKQEDYVKALEVLRNPETYKLTTSNNGKPSAEFGRTFSDGMFIIAEVEIAETGSVSIKSAWKKLPGRNHAGGTPYPIRTPEDTAGSKQSIGSDSLIVNQESVSKVVDENGEPLVVYRSDATEIAKFDKRKARDGFFFHESEEATKSYGGTPRAYYLKITNPLVTERALPNERNASDVKGTDFDGLVNERSDGREFIATQPNQVKSATGNTGTFSPDSADIRFSRRSDLNNYPDEREGSGIEEDPEARFDEDPEALFADIDDAIRKGGGWNEAKGELEKRWNKLNASARRQWLGALTVHQLVELGGKVLPRMERYLKEMTGMDVTRNKVLYEVDAIAKDWEKLDKQALGRLAHVMHESTLAGVDGAEDYVPSIDKKDAIKQIGILKRRMLSVPGDDKWPMLAEIRTLKKQIRFEERREQAYAGIQRMFQALPEDAKDVYVRSRDYHVAQSKRVEQALVEMIEKTQMSGKQRAAAVQKLRTEFEAQRVNAPYFPLSRKGDYWVYTAPPKNSESKAGAEFHMFQTLEEQTAFIQESQAAGMEILGRGKQLENLQETIGVPGSFVAQVEDIIGQLGEGHPLVESVRDQVYQLYLQTLPDLSARKHFIHRKKTPGFGRDALRAFATKGYHDAYQYARVKHGFEMRSIMEKLREDLDVAGSKPKMKALKVKRDQLEEFRDEVLNAGMGYQAVKERAEGLGIQEMETRAQAGKRRLGEGEQFVADEAKKWKQFLTWMDEWKRYGGMPDRVNQEIADIDLRIRTSRLINTRERGYEFGADVYNELQAAYAWLMNPKTAPWATAMNQMGYLYNLAFSPSAWATNATQNPLVAMPYVAAKHGVKNTTAAFTQAYQEAFRGALSKSANKEHALGIRESLSKPDEIQAYDWALEAGLIERGRAMDLAGTAEEGQDRSAWHRKFSMAMTVGFHDVERLNRETSFMASYRLARKAGQDFAGAVDYAGEVVNKTHLVYASENRPRFMRSDVARVLLQFKLYSQGISYLLGKSVVDAVGKNASAEEKAEAKRFLAFQFGMQAAAAGTLGLPIGLAWWAAQAAFGALFDDDDDPKELEPEFREALAEALGTTGGEAAAKGLVNALLPIDLHSRIGMRELWFRENDREAEGKDAASRMMSNLMGPMAGIMENLFVGSQMVSEGHVYRGIEKMMPKFIRDPLKALRYESEGVQTLKGDPLIDDLSTGEFLGQLLGFSPSRLNERYDENNAEKNRQQRIEERRQKLTGDLAQSRIDGAMAQREGDDRKLSKAQSLFEEAMANAKRFNEKQPGFAIGGKTVGRSIQSRVRARAMAKDGIFLNRKIPERYDYATPAEDAE